MESITIDGMDEHDFRHAIEDMLRLDHVEQAAERLRGLLAPYVGGYLPSRFLDISAGAVTFGGWHRLAERLRGYDRPGYPISAIGIALADARALGGPGPAYGRLAPFIKTFYFSDDAYPFTNATREDLLDGYTREGFGWQGDYQASDATLSVKGLDDLHGAIIELEDKLFDVASPPEDAIRAGSIGACYLAVLIHQALRDQIRREGLPRPLCVLAACDGVYPFFDAPVAGSDECEAAAMEEAPEEAEVWPNELEEAAVGPADCAAEGSLLTALHLRTKTPVLVLDAAAAAESLLFTARAETERMAAPADSDLKGLFRGIAAAPLIEAEWHTYAEPAPAPEPEPEWHEPQFEPELLEAEPESEPLAPPPAAPHSLRARVQLAPVVRPSLSPWQRLAAWLGALLPRR